MFLWPLGGPLTPGGHSRSRIHAVLICPFIVCLVRLGSTTWEIPPGVTLRMVHKEKCLNEPTFMMPQGVFPAAGLLSAEWSRLPPPILGLLSSLERPLL